MQALDCVYLLYGREQGESGTPHLQGFIKFDNARSFQSVKKLIPRAHIESCRVPQKAIEYCLKDGDIFEKGTRPEKNGGDSLVEKQARNKRLTEAPLEELVRMGEVHPCQVPNLKKARLILQQEQPPYQAEDVRGVWIYGPPGVGKSHAARQDGDVFIKSQNKWFDGYTGQKTILLDDFDKQGVCLGHYLKIWADKWACTGEVKGGTINLQHDKFVITSNYQPNQLWTEDDELLQAIERRFKFIRMQ